MRYEEFLTISVAAGYAGTSCNVHQRRDGTTGFTGSDFIGESQRSYVGYNRDVAAKWHHEQERLEGPAQATKAG